MIAVIENKYIVDDQFFYSVGQVGILPTDVSK